MNSGLSAEELAEIRKVLGAVPGVMQAILFGSRAKGTAQPGSDVDLALKGCSRNDAVRISAILNEETVLPYFFDVVVYESLQNNDLIDHIDRVGVKIYEK